MTLLSGNGGDGTRAKTTAGTVTSRGRSLGTLCLVGAEGGEQMLSALSTAQGVGALMAVSLEGARGFEEARRLADRDYVTGLLNHRGMNERIKQEVSRSQRTGRPYSLVMMDLDHFKLFNDTYGHADGDRILLEVSQIVAGAVRQYDVVARYGGDEFLDPARRGRRRRGAPGPAHSRQAGQALAEYGGRSRFAGGNELRNSKLPGRGQKRRRGAGGR